MPQYSDQSQFIMLPIPLAAYTAVCALLGGVSVSAVAASAPKASGDAKPDTVGPSALSDNGAAGAPSVISTTATTAASPSDGEVDAGGHPWSEDLHASTKTKTKEGLWRMKVGVSRPDPLPGFPKDTGTASTGTEASAGSSAPAVEEDDEFAAFRDAMGSDKAAPAATARKYTDADLGALSNQAAVKLGDPAPVKALIADYVPEGTVPHSRNIPDDKRADFVAAVEAKADITFAG